MQNNHSVNGAPSGAGSYEHKQALIVILKEFDRVCKMIGVPYILFAGSMLGAVRHQGFIPWDDDIDVLMLRKDYERLLSEAHNFLNAEKFFLQKEFSEHWPLFFSKLRLNNTACIEKYHPKDPKIHQGVYIDIFPCDNAAGTELGRRIQFFASKVVIAKALDRRGYVTGSKKKKAFIGVCRLLPMKPFWRVVTRGRDDSRLVHSFFAAASKYSRNIYPREYIGQTVSAAFEDGEYPISKHYDSLLKILYGDYMQLPPPEQRVIKQHAVLIDLNNSYEMYPDYHKDIDFEVLTQSVR
jgi:lipopolysaccharide cholinephosphotransferase